MAYSVMTITNKGASLFAELASNPDLSLIISGCSATNTSLTLQQAISVVNIPYSEIWNTTDISMSGATTTTALVYAQFISGEGDGGDAYTFMLYGHLSNAPDTDYVISVVSDTTPTKLPSAQDVINCVEIRFGLIFTPILSGQILVPSDNDYTLRSEFNTIKDRVVTTHSQSSTTSGDDQRIYGNKTFSNDLIVSGYLLPESPGASDIGEEDTPFMNVYADDINTFNIHIDSQGSSTVTLSNSNGALLCNSNIDPSGTCKIGNFSKQWDQIHAANFYGTYSNSTTGHISDILECSHIASIFRYSNEVPIMLDSKTVELRGRWEYSTGAVATIYAKSARQPASVGTVDVDASLVLGSSNNNVLPYNAQTSLGNSSKHWSDVYALSLSGSKLAIANVLSNSDEIGSVGLFVIPYYSATETEYLDNLTFSGNALRYISLQSPGDNDLFGEINVVWTDDAQAIPSGTWKVLGRTLSYYNIGGESYHALVIATRIA